MDEMSTAEADFDPMMKKLTRTLTASLRLLPKDGDPAAGELEFEDDVRILLEWLPRLTTANAALQAEVGRLLVRNAELALENKRLREACATLPIIGIKQHAKKEFLILPECNYTIPGDMLTRIINVGERISAALAAPTGETKGD